jgi:hypothetical protein
MTVRDKSVTRLYNLHHGKREVKFALPEALVGGRAPSMRMSGRQGESKCARGFGGWSCWSRSG